MKASPNRAVRGTKLVACRQCPDADIKVTLSNLTHHHIGYRGVEGPLCGACRKRMSLMHQDDIDKMKVAQAVEEALTQTNP